MNQTVIKDDETGIWITQTIKNKPGRPKSNDSAPNIAIMGNSLNEPTKPDIYAEILYSGNIIRYLKHSISILNKNLEFITMQFRKDGLYFNHENLNKEEIVISKFDNAKYMYYYYTKANINIKIMTNTLLTAIKLCKTTTTYIRFIIYEKDLQEYLYDFNGDNYFVGTMYINMHITSNKLSCCTRTPIKGIQPDTKLYPLIMIDDHYLIEFYVGSKEFKGLIPKKDQGILRIVKGIKTPIIISHSNNIGQDMKIANDASNIIINNLMDGQVVINDIYIKDLNNSIQSGEYGINEIYIKLHTTEDPIFSYKIIDPESKVIISYMNFKLILAK